MRALLALLLGLLGGALIERAATKPVPVVAAPKPDDWARSRECATEAREAFRLGDYEKGAVPTNHYNRKLNQCFLLVENSSVDQYKKLWNIKFILDAVEGRSYGEYAWTVRANKTAAESTPFQCNVLLLSGELKYCESSAEFDSLVKVYMEGDAPPAPIDLSKFEKK